MKKLFSVAFSLVFSASVLGQTVPQNMTQLPGVYTDNTVPRRDGAANRFQTSGIVIDDTTSNNTTIGGVDANTDVTVRGGLTGASVLLGRAATGGVTITAANVAGAHVNFLTGGAQRVRIDDTTGNVLLSGLTTDGTGVLQFPTGLGDATSGISFRGSTTFLYSDADGNLTLRYNSGSAYIALRPNSGNNSRITSTVSSDLIFSTANNVTALTLDSSQNATFVGSIRESTDTRSGPGAVSVTKTTTKVTTTGALDALTLADGVDGQVKRVIHDVDGGSFVLTPTTKTGWSTFTSTVVGESISLQFVTTRGWIVIGSYLGTIAP